MCPLGGLQKMLEHLLCSIPLQNLPQHNTDSANQRISHPSITVESQAGVNESETLSPSKTNQKIGQPKKTFPSSKHSCSGRRLNISLSSYTSFRVRTVYMEAAGRILCCMSSPKCTVSCMAPWPTISTPTLLITFPCKTASPTPLFSIDVLIVKLKALPGSSKRFHHANVLTNRHLLS